MLFNVWEYRCSELVENFASPQIHGLLFAHELRRVYQFDRREAHGMEHNSRCKKENPSQYREAPKEKRTIEGVDSGCYIRLCNKS